MRKYREYTDEQLLENAKNVFSIAGLLRTLNLKPAGGNYAHIKCLLKRLNVNTDHWTGQGWTKNKQLKDWASYRNPKHIKKPLIRLRGHKCEKCLNDKWFDNPIQLEIHHVDGDRLNNKLENLELLCCNCHATTGNWRNKKRVDTN